MSAPARFVLPRDAEATAPPRRRDAVRLLVARPGRVEHRRFRDLDRHLAPGDLLVVNTSATLPAALDVRRRDGRTLRLHVSTSLDDGSWVVEPRRADGAGPERDVRAGEELTLPGGVALTLLAPYPVDTAVTRLWTARCEVAPDRVLPEHGRPIGYGYLTDAFGLAEYQTVYATEAGSAEMASAGRPLTERRLVALMARGVVVAPLVLHAGVSSQEKHEPPMPERFTVPPTTARLVTATRESGRRVVAVGTTVVRALETAAGPDGTVRAASGWTDLVLGPDRPARAVTGLVSGLHAPEASHLSLLDAVAGPELVGRAYDAAVATGLYRWHEFGDSMLFLP